jgi:hypothetical protein
MKSDYSYRKSRFLEMEKSWSLERLHDLMVAYTPTNQELKDLRFAIMLYISKALYFDFTEDEEAFIKRVDLNRKVRDNVTPNGGIVPKKEYQVEYNMVLRSWSRIINSIIKDKPVLMTKFRMTPNIRVKFGKELEDNINRTLSTSHPHSDAWVEGPWSLNCYTPILGDVQRNNLLFWEPKSKKKFKNSYLNTAATYEEMHWVLNHYKPDPNLKPEKGKVHISDYALIHATNRENNCGTRVSIDTTILVGDHDVHPDREPEYAKDFKIIGEDLLVSTNRSVKDDLMIHKKTTFSHYTTGNLKFYECK